MGLYRVQVEGLGFLQGYVGLYRDVWGAYRGKWGFGFPTNVGHIFESLRKKNCSIC